jgi:hypothetical protein
MSKRLVLLAVGGALLLSASAARAQDWRTLTGQRRHAGEDRLRVEVEFGAGSLGITPATGGTLYQASLRYDADNFQPVHTYRAGVLKLGLEGGGRIRRNVREGARLSLALGTDVPLDLKLAFGAAEADLELGGLRVRNAEIATGASDSKVRFSHPNPERLELLQLKAGAAAFRAIGLGNANARRIKFDGGVGDVVLDFTGEWHGDTDVEVSIGVGSLTLRLPRGVGVKIGKETFLVAFDSNGLVKRADGYYSEDWDRAEHHLTIGLSGAFGSIDVRWVTDSGAGDDSDR